MSDFTEIWVYLSSSPLLHLTLTLIAYQIGDWAYKRSGGLGRAEPRALGRRHARRGAADYGYGLRHIL